MTLSFEQHINIDDSQMVHNLKMLACFQELYISVFCLYLTTKQTESYAPAFFLNLGLL